ncbi:uncharacterized protein LOC126253571 isoform X3 [Schistocerca nitens]|uniref:uncharacterized protein LOC126253571 isoform X3 n=1 Tax=Schistocerca nitens TaxID=7011 RepID=UPI0021181D75|nr:uncharacterized protein LOC126253571 isoform X3 [Schistocerca nitens]
MLSLWACSHNLAENSFSVRNYELLNGYETKRICPYGCISVHRSQRMASVSTELPLHCWISATSVSDIFKVCRTFCLH